MDRLTTQLEQLEYAQLVRRLPDEDLAYLFKHALTRESAYESLLLKKRRDIHHLVGEAYERLYPERLDEFAALLTLHYAEAGDAAKTLEYATRSGDAASRIFANDEAIAFYKRAIDVAKRSAAATEQWIHLYTQLGYVLELSGKYAEAVSAYEEMAELAGTRNDSLLQLSSLMLRAAARADRGPNFDPATAQQLCDEALALARELGDETAQARILWTLELVSMSIGHVPQAIEYGEQALAIARALSDSGRDMRGQIAHILKDLFLPYRTSKQRELADKVIAQAIELCHDLDDKRMLVDSLAQAAQTGYLSGDFAPALEWAQEGAAQSQLIGSPFGLLSSQETLTFMYLELGDLSEALRLTQEMVALAQPLNTHHILQMSALSAWLLGTLGAFAPAAEMERRAREAVSAPMLEYYRGLGLAYLARLNIARGNVEAANMDLAASLRSFDLRFTTTPVWFQQVIAESELALGRGDPACALQATDALLVEARAEQYNAHISELLYWKGKALAAQGQRADARAAWQEARALAERMNTRRILWQILAALSEIEKESGNESEARKLLEAAQTVVTYIADHTPVELRPSFLNLQQVRLVLDAHI